MVNMKMRVDDHLDITGMKAPFFQRLKQAMSLMCHARIDDNMMVAPGEQCAGSAPPTSGKQHFRLPR